MGFPRRHRTGIPPTPAPQGSTTKHAQEELAHLGYTGLDGKLIQADGRAGRNTRHAVEQYQRDHGLAVTGVLDGATWSRLDRDERTMASSTHPAHGLYSESLTAVAELDRRLNVPPGPYSLALAAAVAAGAAQAGMTHVDRIELSRDGRLVQAVQFRARVDGWATNRTSAPLELRRATNQPLEVSSDHARRAMDARTRAEQHAAREHAPMRAPVL